MVEPPRGAREYSEAVLRVLHTRAQVRIPTTDELACTRTHAGAHLRLLAWHLFLVPSGAGFTPGCWRDYDGSVS